VEKRKNKKRQQTGAQDLEGEECFHNSRADPGKRVETQPRQYLLCLMRNRVEVIRPAAAHPALPPRWLYGITKGPMSEVVIEPAIFEDLDELSNLLGELFSEEKDFRPNKQKQLQGLRLIFEEPNRGRVFVLRRDRTIVAMINLLFTISTAEGGFVILLEDLVVHDSFRGHGYGSQLLEYAINFAKQKKFLRITLLTDRPELRSQNFFKRHGFFESHMLPMRLLISSDQPAATTL
jgi:GNAT superfamily N-acetyltransferase